MDNFPKESIQHPGFYEIPGFSRYVISINGSVINKETNTYLDGSKNPDGYVNYRLTGDDRHCLTWGRHRLLCYVFKHPGIDIANLTVNHINGVKGDDRLDNLEWATYQGNLEHAGALGLTQKCIPISVRDTDSGEVRHYPSIIECARELGLTKDAINYRIRIGEVRVFPERKQYRLQSNLPWFIPNSIDHALLKNGTSKAISVRNVWTGRIQHYDQMSQVANVFGVSAATLTMWVNRKDQPVLPNFVQMKWTHDQTPWRKIGDPYLELAAFTGQRPVKIINDKTGEVIIFAAASVCAQKMNLQPTTLNYRLKSNGLKVFSDGYRYGYYPY